MPLTERERSDPSDPSPSEEECVFFIRVHGLILDGPSAVRVYLGGLALSDSSSGLGRFPPSPLDFCYFRHGGIRTRIDDFDTP